jgi:hypothetical protein
MKKWFINPQKKPIPFLLSRFFKFHLSKGFVAIASIRHGEKSIPVKTYATSLLTTRAIILTKPLPPEMVGLLLLVEGNIDKVGCQNYRDGLLLLLPRLVLLVLNEFQGIKNLRRLKVRAKCFFLFNFGFWSIPFLLSFAIDRERDGVSEKNKEGDWEIEKRKKKGKKWLKQSKNWSAFV